MGMRMRMRMDDVDDDDDPVNDQCLHLMNSMECLLIFCKSFYNHFLDRH